MPNTMRTAIIKLSALLCLVLAVLPSCRTRQATLPVGPMPHEQDDEHSQSVFLVMYDAEVGKQPLLQAIKDYGCEVVYDYHFINGMALKKPNNKTLEETMRHFGQVAGVVAVEYDHITRLTDPVRPKLEMR